jgi:hypothetical protein
MVNNNSLIRISKWQKTVEMSMYGSKLVAPCIAVDLIIEWWYILLMLGVKIEKSSYLLGDNMPVVFKYYIAILITQEKTSSM